MLYRFSEYELDEERHELRRAGAVVAVEPKMYQVLLYLLTHHDRVVSKEELLDHCWPQTFVSEAALSRCLSKLRKTVQDDATGGPLIKTVHGAGYRLTAPVTTLPPGTRPGSCSALDASRPSERSTILIVDDDADNRDLLQRRLSRLGYETVSASNGQEALEMVANEPPDLILLDVMMPLIDGFTACRILKGHEDTRLIPILIMTALGEVNDRIQGLEAGADDFLTKPVDKRELLARVRSALTLKHTIDRKVGELHHLKEHIAAFVRHVVPPESSDQ